MIHIACGDKQDETLVTAFNYLIQAFALSTDQFHDSPPEGEAIVLIQPLDGTYEQGDINLVDFVHPDNCCYWFGNSHGQLILDSHIPDYKVYIPQIDTWDLFASQAAAVVLYDRYVKRGDFG